MKYFLALALIAAGCASQKPPPRPDVAPTGARLAQAQSAITGAVAGVDAARTLAARNDAKAVVVLEWLRRHSQPQPAK